MVVQMADYRKMRLSKFDLYTNRCVFCNVDLDDDCLEITYQVALIAHGGTVALLNEATASEYRTISQMSDRCGFWNSCEDCYNRAKKAALGNS